ncbi:uncharacterized protein LOC141724773 [Apium graveolens]|uniref:uncharacterized protein LOC141724773 n=1 Tax=Apium graveolens TaxID=4045 RepID=UPI003D7AF154
MFTSNNFKKRFSRMSNFKRENEGHEAGQEGLTGQPPDKRIKLVVEPTSISHGKRYYRELRRRQDLESRRIPGHAMNVIQNVVHNTEDQVDVVQNDAESPLVPRPVLPNQGAGLSAPVIEPSEAILSDEQTSSSHQEAGGTLGRSKRIRRPNSKYLDM